MKAKVLVVLGAGLTLGALFLSLAVPANAQGVVCFPTCDRDDGRFLVIATGESLETLGGQTLRIKLAVPSDQASATLEFFDGDSGTTDSDGIPHWDLLSNPVTYTLFADPNTDGSELIEIASLTSDDMIDDEWLGFDVQTSEIAAADSGNFFYQLEIIPGDVDTLSVNALKIRSTGFIYFGVQEQPFAFMATWTNPETDLPLIYPNYNPDDRRNPANLIGSNYDGTFDFYLDLQLPTGAPVLDEFSMWDGDLDRGDFDGGNSDTDDTNTPNEEFPFFDVDMLSDFEGVADGTDPSTGAPPDNVDPDSQDGFGIYNVRTPSVEYAVFSPATELIAVNTDPSGNREWEHFALTTGILDAEVHDAQVEALEPGVYSVRLRGMDMNNLNAWFFEGRVLCQQADGDPCEEGPRPYLIGDTVWYDANENETQDPLEPGLSGVVMNNRAADGTVLETTLTDADGLYFFDTWPGDYTVEVDPLNFEPANPLGALGDTVWLDVNGDGFQDPFEPGIPSVRIELLTLGLDGIPYTADDRIAAVQLTDSSGRYFFRNLGPDSYYTLVDNSSLVAGLRLSGGTDPSPVRTVLSDEVFVDLDFGYARANAVLGALGDRVWADMDSDGEQDPGEPGIGNVTLTLTRIADGLQVDATTTAGGYYLFTGLEFGDYEVNVTDTNSRLIGYVETANPGILSVAGINVTGDFGYFRDDLHSISNVVWFDADRDRVFDPNEVGVGGVTVSLTDSLGDSLMVTETAADGTFTFDGLSDADYTLVVTDFDNVLSGRIPTTPPMLDGELLVTVAGSDISGVDFGVVNEGALVGFEPTTMSPTQTNTVVEDNVLTYDFGYVTEAGLGDRVWLDLDGDGEQDGGEPGVPDVTLTLEGDNGIMLETTTDADGMYFFEVIGGNYTVAVDPSTLPPDLAQTFDLDGILDDQTTVPLDFFEVRLDVDFGYQPVGGTIGDRVWRDDDGDGVQDGAEGGIPGVTVILEDENGNVLDTAVTDGDGLYLFTDLSAGIYTVRIDPSTLPDRVVQTGDPDGVLDDQSTVDLGPGEDNLDQDFGYQPLGTIGDRVWQDLDRDGNQDPGEPGIPGITMLLKDENGNVLDTAVTGADGVYLFTDLPAAIYRVCVDTTGLPPGFEQTGDPDGVLDNETTVDLGPGEEEFDADFGYADPPVGSLGDRVWSDTDGDGVQDPGEPGLNGVTVQLRDPNGPLLDEQTTAGDGGYLFTDLPAGNYTIGVVVSSLPPGVVQTGDPDGVLDNRTTVSLPPGGNDLTNDFGYQPASGSIGDRVWEDTDGDGTQDPGEPGIPGVRILLKDDAGNVLDTQVTDGSGMYLFTDRGPGTYTVCIDVTTLPDGYIPTFDPDGGLDNEASGTLKPGEDVDTVDWGYQPNDPCLPKLDFELDSDGNPLEAGQIIDDEFAGITITTSNPDHPAMIFDSANPTGGDRDLGTPNEDFGGPGIGEGGEAGQPGENALPRGKVLILSEDGNPGNPDDNSNGGTITFDFDNLVEVTRLGFIDIEEAGGSIVAYDANGNVITTSAIPVIGDNGVQAVGVGASGIAKLDVNFASSGAVTKVVFCIDDLGRTAPADR